MPSVPSRSLFWEAVRAVLLLFALWVVTYSIELSTRAQCLREQAYEVDSDRSIEAQNLLQRGLRAETPKLNEKISRLDERASKLNSWSNKLFYAVLLLAAMLGWVSQKIRFKI